MGVIGTYPGTMGEMATRELTTLDLDDQAALLGVPGVSAVTRGYLEAAQAPNTRRAYRADWAHFADWCAERAVDALPAAPETVADYVADSAAGGRAASTIRRRLAAVRSAHLTAGYAVSPTSAALVGKALAGVRRTHGIAPRQKAAITTAEMRAMVSTLDPTTPLGARDRAILLLGYATGMRRSELAALDVDDLEVVADAGLRIRMRRSKTDQEGLGRWVGVLRGRSAETCAVRAVQAWLEQLGSPETGPLFLHVRRGGHVTADRVSAKVVAMVVQRTALAAGLDPSRLGGHSLRAGMVTTATRNRAPLARVMAQSGHVRLDTLMGYVREAELFDDNASGYLGL
jgi:site-specific recombinase XerD